ncbi:MAG: glycosyltransferase, partial [Jiangellales bacterium]
AQACGTPVVAASVGGLRTAVADGSSGLLIGSHDPSVWAESLGRLLSAPAEIERLGQGARLHARRFGWDATAQGTLDCYVDARAGRERQLFSSLTVAQ